MPENIVVLTAREHFICHLLLPKMTEGLHRQKASFAVWMMLVKNKSQSSRYLPPSKLYEIARKLNVQAQKEKIVSAETRKKIGNAHRGKIVSSETREKIRIARTGMSGTPHTDEWKKTMSEQMMGHTHTMTTKQKIGNAHRGKIISEEAKQKMIKTNAGRYISKCIITLQSPDGKIFKQHPHQKAIDFCTSHGMKYQTVKLAYDLNRTMRNKWTIVSIEET